MNKPPSTSVRRGYRNPLAALFMMNNITRVLIIVSLLAVSACASPLWTAEIALDDVKIWLTPKADKAEYASELALERVQEISGRTEEEALKAVYSVQEMLTIIEKNINVQGNAHKALRKQQTTEDNLRELRDTLKEQTTETEEYKLAIEHAIMRTGILLEEIEIAKQKTKNRIE